MKEFRQSKGLFQSDIAEILGANQSTVSRMELRPYADLAVPQYRTLCERFGKEEVDAFTTQGDANVEVVGNTNNGGTQDNSVSVGNDGTMMEVIRRQADVLADVVRKQSEQADRLLGILERLTSGQ